MARARMSSLAVLVLLAPIEGCAPAWVLDPALAARAAPTGLRARSDGTVQLGDWTLVTSSPPTVTQRPHPNERDLVLREVRSTLSLREPDGATWTGDCLFRGSGGGVVVSAQASMECDFDGPGGRNHLLLTGNNADDFFGLSSARGHVRGPVVEWATMPAPQPGEATERARFSVAAEGTPRALNFYRAREDARYLQSAWRTSCCTSLEAVAAVSVWNPEALYVAPELEPALRVQVMLAAGALVSVRGVTAVPAVE